MITRVHIAVLALLVALGVTRVVATYSDVGVTYDEPAHLAAGMERLQWGTYTYETMHPPLARVMVAVGPYLAGARLTTHRDVSVEGQNILFQEGNSIYYQDPASSRMLVLSRLGTLSFLILGCIVTFLWGARWFSPEAGLVAVALLICTPPILTHSGVATNDMACAAATMGALYQFLRWLESRSPQPDWTRAIWLAVAFAAAFLSKFSSIVFLAPCCIAAVILGWRHIAFRGRLKSIATIVLVVFGLMWACYGFTLVTLDSVWGPHPRIDAMLAQHPALKSIWTIVVATRLPLTEVVTGLRDLSRHNALGHDSFLLGEYRNTGWWYFFPVVLAVKTPIGLLQLAWTGAALILFSLRRNSWPRLATLVFPFVILGVCMLSSIDLGVRHILPIYPLLALLSAHAIVVGWTKFKAAVGQRAISAPALAGLIPALLMAWVVVDSIQVHPDYLAYFNAFAGPHPETILAESDLDWGQDLGHLSTRLKQLDAKEVSIAYFGSALLDNSGLPPYHELDPSTPAKGYVAISLHRLTIDHAKDGSYDWLKDYKPRERIGKSIDLFYVP